MCMMRKLLAFASLQLLLMAAIPHPSWAADTSPGAVRITNAWIDAMPDGAKTAAGYMTLTSPRDDRLTGASSPDAVKTELHSMTMAGGMMRMRPVTGGLPLPAGQAVSLKDKGMHLMLTGVRSALKAGDTVSVTLDFAKAGPETVSFTVKPGGDMTGQDKPMSMPGMSGSPHS